MRPTACVGWSIGWRRSPTTSPPDRSAVNIHQVLDRVRALAANGVAEGLALKESYDPSLPPVWGDEDQLIQIFLNLVKNAAEAAHARGDDRGRIAISTAYRHGVRIRRRRRQGGPGRAVGGAGEGQRPRCAPRTCATICSSRS